MTSDDAVTTARVDFGLYCVGSSIGLMVMLLALGVMSVTWSCIVATVILVQKLLAPQAVVDVPVALAILTHGVVAIVGRARSHLKGA